MAEDSAVISRRALIVGAGAAAAIAALPIKGKAALIAPSNYGIADLPTATPAEVYAQMQTHITILGDSVERGTITAVSGNWTGAWRGFVGAFDRLENGDHRLAHGAQVEIGPDGRLSRPIPIKAGQYIGYQVGEPLPEAALVRSALDRKRERPERPWPNNRAERRRQAAQRRRAAR